MANTNMNLFDDPAAPPGDSLSPGNFRELPRRRRPPPDRGNVADGAEDDDDEGPVLLVWGKYQRRTQIGVQRHVNVSISNPAEYGQVSFQLENIHTARRCDLVHEVINGAYKVHYTLSAIGLYHVHVRSYNRTVHSFVILGHEARPSVTSQSVGSGLVGPSTGGTLSQPAFVTPGLSTEPTPGTSSQPTSAERELSEMQFRPFGKRKLPGQESENYERTISMSFTPRLDPNLLELTPPPWLEHSMLTLTEQGGSFDAGYRDEPSWGDGLSGGLYALDDPEPAQERVFKWATRRFGVPVSSVAPAGSESERWSRMATIASVDVPPTPPPPKKRKPVLLTRINTNYILPPDQKFRTRRPVNYRV